MRPLTALAASALLLAGCLSSAPETGDSPLAPQGAVSALCDPDRPAVSHGPGGEPRASSLVIVPCLSKTGHVSREPTIGITSTGTVFHYPAMVADNTRPTGVSVSRDRGARWDMSMPTINGIPSHPSSLDPYLYVDPDTDRVFVDDLANPFCSYASWSDDEGRTWENTVAGCLESDHQTIFAGRPVTSTPSGYPNVVYRCAMNAVALGGSSTLSTCQKSTDGGRTWLPPEEPAFQSVDPERPGEMCGAAHGHGIADAAGTIYLPKGHCGLAMVAISEDEGATWRRVAASTEVGTSDHEVGVGVDRDGAIYVTWIGTDGLPYLAHSADAGVTWSEPLMFGPPGIEDAVFPEVYVGAPGRVAVAYMAGFGNGTYDAVMTIAYDALDPSPTFHSATINDPVADAFVVGGCCGGVQDFLDVRIAPDGTAWGAFVDDCIGPGRDCSEYTEALDTQRQGVAGWLLAPSLWDEADPNGVYP